MLLEWIFPVLAVQEVVVDKNLEKINEIHSDPLLIQEATSNLAENLIQSEAFLKLKQAEQALNENEKATTLLNDFEKLRQKIVADQNNGNFSESDLTQFRGLQMEIAENEVIQEYNQAQESAKELLKDVNQEISQIIGVNFATLAQRSSGCC